MSEVLKVDLHTPEFDAAFSAAPFYRKNVFVRARVLTEAERIVTTTADGVIEADVVAQPGDVVVTEPSGLEFVPPKEKFFDRNEPTDKPGIYRAKGLIRATANTTGETVEIQASWGPQTGAADCIFALLVDPDAPDDLGADRYIIDHMEFNNNFVPIRRADIGVDAQGSNGVGF